MTRREIPLDAGAIFRVLGEHGVDYVVIGGLAVQAHGHVRTTQDVDIVPAPGTSNLKRLAAALVELHARPAGSGRHPPRGWPPPAALERDTGPIGLDTVAGGLDVHPAPPGAAPFDELRERALVLEVAGASVPMVGRSDLIAMKRASGRPVDRGDVIALTEPEHEEHLAP